VHVQERDDGQDAAVIVVGVGQPELRQDAVHVLLDGPLGDPQAPADARIGAPLGHLLEHIALAAGERLERVVDVALIDIDLRGESGFELARRLHENADGVAVPHVILISTHDEAEYSDLIEASSALGFLAKIDLSATAIRRLLAVHQIHRSE
jgi:CheY-like chemotaxis protein